MLVSFLLISILSTFTVPIESKVCSSVDVRNGPEYIAKYKDCRVIEGNLHVVLMETVEDFTEYFGNSFFELTEITDYLLMYRVLNLPSLGLLFPNLTTIKGNKLFLNQYAIVLYEIPQLEEIGLSSLNSIRNGSVKINNCDNLCYVNTVNWTHLGASFINYDGKNCESAQCPNECGGLCWNNYECQKMVKPKCHDFCIGCSKSNSTRHCHLCKFYNDSGNCVHTCPSSKITDNIHSKCITSSECTTKNEGWSIYKNLCVPECPDGFESSQNGICVETIIKTCSGFKVTTHFDLEQLVGCVHINGALEFATIGSIDALDFEKALGNITIISGFLKIVRSDTIASLNFFKSLKKIQGEDLWSGSYSFFVTQNQNLQQLFRNTTNVAVEKGEVFFQDNPHLCESEIKKVKANFSKSNNNGYHAACGSTTFSFTMVERNATNVTIKWDPQNNTAGFIFYYAPHDGSDRHVKLRDRFLDKESLTFDRVWDSLMTLNNTILVKNLVAFTEYDFFVMTVFLNQPPLESPIYHFKTATDDPSDPMDLEAEAQTDSSIFLKWTQPSFLNGILAHYKLTVYEEKELYPNLLQERNYCRHPFKVTDCDCPLKKEENNLFLINGTCFETGSDFCTKTVYKTENAKARIKRSTPVVEQTINPTLSDEQIYAVYNLRHFTLYNFFIEACNKLDSDKIQHCSGKATTFQRTKKKLGADDITNFSIKIENTEATITWEKLKDSNGVLVYYVEYRQKNASVVMCQQNIDFKGNVCKVKISRLSEGQYSVRVWATSLAGEGKKSDWKVFAIVGESSGMRWVYGFLGFFSFVAVIIIGLILWNKYQAKKEDANDYNMIVRMNAPRNICDDDDEWKLDEETVEIVKELRGNFLAILHRRN